MPTFKTLREYGIPVDRKVFVIAEIGINHGGDLSLAKRLIDSAAQTGCDSVKFQTYVTEKRTTKGSPIFDILKKCELPESAYGELKKHAEDQKLEFFSTPFDVDSVELLLGLGVQLFKLASFDVVNKALLRKVAATGKTAILSVGMADLAEVKAAYAILREHTRKVALLHCVSSYPTKPADANLAGIFALREQFDAVIGQSDHTDGIEVPLYAVAAGAQVIEKHYRIDSAMECVDAPVSITQEQMTTLVARIRSLEQILGTESVRLEETEKGTLQYRRTTA